MKDESNTFHWQQKYTGWVPMMLTSVVVEKQQPEAEETDVPDLTEAKAVLAKIMSI